MGTKQVTVAICNFNTTELTNACIKSICNKLKSIEYKFLILDNSDKIPFKLTLNYGRPITVLGNTHGKYINFDLILSNCSKIHIDTNSNASLKHCYSIQYLLNICTTNYMLLFDSDTILKRDIDFIDNNYITVADTELYKKISAITNESYCGYSRFLPFILYFNIDKIRSSKISYFDANRMHGGMSIAGNLYDTGASFYEDCIKTGSNYLTICHTDYIDHLLHGSWKPLDKS